MRKIIFFAIATVFFAVTTMFNMNLVQSNNTGDISLESIAIMAQADPSETNDGMKWISRKNRFGCSGEYTVMGVKVKKWSCTNCAWDCEDEEVREESSMKSNCSDEVDCDDRLESDFSF